LKRLGTILAGAILALSAARAYAGEDGGAFAPGEQATYKVQFLGIPAGDAKISVEPETQQNGAKVWPIVTEAKSARTLFFFKVRDRFVTLWDNLHHRSVGSELYASEGSYHWQQQIQFDHSTNSAVVSKQVMGSPVEQTTMEVPKGSFDVAAAAFALRNRSLEVGHHYELPLFTGAKSFTLRADVLGREVLNTAIGRREVLRIRAQTEFSGKLQSKRDIIVFLTADSAHVPVRFEAEFLIGRIIANITGYQGGTTLASASGARANHG